MADKYSAIALREVGSLENVKDQTVEKILDKYAGAIVKAARKEERASLFQAAGAQAFDELSQLNQLRAERDARPTRDEELKHGRHRFYQGGLLGVCIGAILASALIFAMQGVIWDTAARNFREQAMTGAILRAGEETLP